MSDTDLLLSRLRDDERHLRSLVSLVAEDLLSRPVHELVDPAWLAERLVDGLRTSAEDERTRAWVRRGLDELRARGAKEQGTLGQRISPDLVGPVKDLLRRPYAPEPTLVRAVLDHRAVRELIRDLLYTILSDWARKVQVPAKGAADALRSSPLRGTRLAQIAGVAQVAARVVGSEVEHLLEGRIREYVDGAIGRSIDIAVEHFCAPEHAEDVGAWRADSVDVLLWFPMSTWLAELEKLDPEGVIDDVTALIRALAGSQGFADQVREALELAVDQAGAMSARDFLDGSGLEEGWRPHIEELLLERSRAFVAGEAFAGWLRELVEG